MDFSGICVFRNVAAKIGSFALRLLKIRVDGEGMMEHTPKDISYFSVMPCHISLCDYLWADLLNELLPFCSQYIRMQLPL